MESIENIQRFTATSYVGGQSKREKISRLFDDIQSGAFETSLPRPKSKSAAVNLATSLLNQNDDLISIDCFILLKFADVLDDLLCDNAYYTAKKMVPLEKAYIIPGTRKISESKYWDSTCDYSSFYEFVTGTFLYSVDLSLPDGEVITMDHRIQVEITFSIPESAYCQEKSAAEMVKWHFDFSRCYDDYHGYNDGYEEQRSSNKKDDKVYLDKYLAANRPPWDVADVCDEVMTRLFPDEMEQDEPVSPEKLAKALGLNVIRLRLASMPGVKSLYVQKAQKLPVKVDGKPNPVIVSVPKGTIVINSPKLNLDLREKFYIAHECWHCIGQIKFNLLQKKIRTELSKCMKQQNVIPCMKQQNVIPMPDDFDSSASAEKKAVMHKLENEANIAANFLCFPSMIAEHEIDELLKKYKDEPNVGKRWEKAISELSNRHSLSKSMVRHVFTYTGHIAAKGAFNFVDGRYIAAFGFDGGFCTKGKSFVISMKEAMECYATDSTFRELINSGAVLYADGHICINSPDYIYERWFDVRTEVDDKMVNTRVLRYFLTEKALCRINRCCLEFYKDYSGGISDTTAEGTGYYYRYGMLRCDSSQFNSIKCKAQSCTDNISAKRIIAEAYNIYTQQVSLPSSFGGTLEYHRKAKNMSREKLAEAADIADKTIQRIEIGETKRFSFETVLRLAIGLRLNVISAQDFFAKAGYEIKDNVAGNALRFLLANIEGTALQNAKDFAEAYICLENTDTQEEAELQLEKKRNKTAQ